MMNSLTQASTLTRQIARKTVSRTFAAPASSENLVRTSLYDLHLELGGDMVPFAGYELPVLYKGDNGGVMKEHLWCRADGKASLFDVSHMGQVRRALSLPDLILPQNLLEHPFSLLHPLILDSLVRKGS